MYKAYKFRLYPDDTQRKLINKTFGCTRFIYNHFLDKCMIETYNLINKTSKRIKQYKELY